MPEDIVPTGMINITVLDVVPNLYCPWEGDEHGDECDDPMCKTDAWSEYLQSYLQSQTSCCANLDQGETFEKLVV